MDLRLTLPPDLATHLSEAAARNGLPLDQYALDILSDSQQLSQTPKSGAELVAYWREKGLIGMRPDIADPVEHSRLLRRDAERRERP